MREMRILDVKSLNFANFFNSYYGATAIARFQYPTYMVTKRLRKTILVLRRVQTHMFTK